MEEIKNIEENQGEKKEVQINDHWYRFEEMRDQMMQSLTNINRVLKQQRRLMTIVEEAIKDDEDKEKQPFEEFIKDTEEQNKKLEEQKEILARRIGFLNAVLIRCKDNSDNAELVSLLAEALGMFRE